MATPAEIKDAELKVSKAKTVIVLRHPFWASILLRHPITITDSIPTACVSASCNIKVNPAFIKSLTVNQVVFLLAHEVGHVIMDHMTRRGVRNPELWNIAGDAVINDLLIDGKVGEFITGGVAVPGSAARTTDDVYNDMLKDTKKVPSLGGAGHDMDESGEDEKPLSPDEQDRIRNEIRVEVAQAAQIAKARGAMTGALGDFVARLLEVKTPWHQILERYMVGLTRADYSWARPNRRFINTGHYLPSTGTTSTMGVLAIQIDVSGSISKTELDYYNSHLQRIIDQCHPEQVHVMYTDTRVAKHQVFEAGEEFSLQFYSGGGTNMPAGFDFLKEQGIEPDVLVTLTDGYTPWGSPPGYPVVWCISSTAVADHGETIHFEMEV